MAQKLDAPRQSATNTTATPDAGGALHFEGTVDLGGKVTGELLSVLFGPESSVNGKLRFDGSVRIDGSFRGAIKTNDALVVGENAKIEADIACGSAVVSGEIVGNITASEGVELDTTARVKGDVTSPSLSVAKGAMFDGASRMGASPAKRAGRP
jgi:cytoskeletal protein CcmA (bactofilin family)